MAGKGVIGGKIVLEGEKEYRQALKNINSEQKELRSEMKLSAETYKDNADSLEALTEKQEILSKQVETQTEKVKIYAEAVEKLNESRDKEQEKIEKLSEEYQNAQEELQRLSQEYGEGSEEVQKQAEEVEALRKKLENSQEAYEKSERSISDWKTSLNNAQTELIGMQRELEQTEEKVQNASQGMEDSGDNVRKFGDEIDQAGGKVNIFGDVLKANLAADFIGDALEAATEKIKEFVTEGVEMASDLAESQNVVDVTFKNSSDNINAWAQNLSTSYGMSELAGKQFVGTMGAMLSSMGLTEQQVYDMSTSLVELTGDMASFYNLDHETAFEKLRSGISGETEPLKQLGINMSVVNLEAFAMTQGIDKAYDEMTQAEQATLRYNYILQATADAQGDFARTSDSYANQMRIMQLQMDNIKIAIGKGIVPELTRGAQEINEELDGMGEGIDELAGEVAGKLVDAFLFLVDNSELVAAGIAGITASAVASKTAVPIITAVSTLWGIYKTRTDAATASQTGLNIAMSANPAGILITAIAGLVTAMLTLSQTMSDQSDEFDKEIQKYEESRQKIQENAETRAKSSEDMKNQSAVIQQLSADVERLNAKESLSTEEKIKMAAAVDQLNQAMPELNLAIDDQTGKLAESNEEIEKMIENQLQLMEAEAAQEDMQQIAEDLYEAKKNLAEITELQAEVQQQLTEKEEEYQAALEETAEKAGMITSGYVLQKDAAYELINEVNELKSRNEEYNEQIAEQQELVDSLNEDYEQIAGSIYGVAEATEEAAGYQVYYKDRLYEIQGATQETIDSIEGLREAYAEAVVDADTSIMSQVGLFQELRIESDLTVAQMSENLQSQTDAFNQYAEDLSTASKLANEGSSPEFNDILDSIAEMGMEGAGYLHELVTAAETDSEEFNEILSNWADMTEARGNLTETMADIQTNYSETMDEILGIVSDSTEEQKGTMETNAEETRAIVAEKNDAMVQDTSETMTEMTTAIQTNAPLVKEQVRLLAEGAVKESETALNIVEGKSLKFQAQGKAITDGLAQGIRNGSSTVNQAIRDMINSAVSSVDVSGIVASIDRKLGDALRG